jgi:hypothetical protein
MKYYATVYTGSLTPGEYLTKEQVDKLGDVKIADMVRRGALRAVDDTPKTESPVKKAKPEPVKVAEPEPEEPEADEEDIELPELTADEVAGEAPAEKPKKGGRRKTK